MVGDPLLDRRNHCLSSGSRSDWMRFSRGHFVIGLAAKPSTGLRFLYAAPLLKKKRDSSCFALPLDVENPRLLHRSSSVTAFTSDDDPMDAVEVDFSDVLKQRLDGKETHGRRRRAHFIDPRQTVFAVLDADAPPNVLALS